MFGMLAMLRRLSMLGALLPGVGIATSAASLSVEVLRFLTTPVGKWLALGLLGVAMFIAGDWYRAGIAAQQWRAALAESKLQAAARDEKIREAMSVAAATRV